MLNFPIKINGTTIMSQDVYKRYRDTANRSKATSYIIEQTGCSQKEADEVLQDLIDMVKGQQNASCNPDPIEKRSQLAKQTQAQTYMQNHSPLLKCPKCGSAAVTTGARGVNGFWGFIGASKTVNRCGNCGHVWKPGR